MTETAEQPSVPESSCVGAGFSPHSASARAEARAYTVGPAHAWVALWACIAAYLGLVGAFVIFHHESFRTQAFDLGIFDQALWLVSHGKAAFVTVRGLHRFGDHTEFILYLLAPAYWIWDDVRCALLLQTVVIALGALPVFLLARKRMGYAAAACFGLVYLVNPSVQNLNLDHVHAEAFAATALLFAYYFASERRFALMFVLCGLAMLCKEDVAIATGAFGILVAWRWNRKIGLTLLAVSVVWFFLCMKLFLPIFNDTGFFRFGNGGWFAGWSAHKWDLAWYRQAFWFNDTTHEWAAGRYLLHLLGPLAFLPLLSPATALVAFPAILINCLSTTSYLRSIDYHYMTSITPFLFAAAIEGAARIASKPLYLALPCMQLDRRERVILLLPGIRLVGPVLSQRIVYASVMVVVLGMAVWGNMALSHFPLHRVSSKLREVVTRSRTAPAVLAAQAAIAKLPTDAVVSADYLILPHIAHRQGIYMFPNPFAPESWGIRDRNTHDPNTVQYILVQDGLLNPAKRKIIAGLLKSGQFQEAFSSSGVRLYERIAAMEQPVLVRPVTGHGLLGVFFAFESSLQILPDARDQTPAFQGLFPTIDFPSTEGEFVSEQGIRTGMNRRFMARFDGFLQTPEEGEYEFAVWSDDGFRLSLSGQLASECNKLHSFGDTRNKLRLPKGLVPIELLFFDNEPPHGLRLEWRRPGSAVAEVIRPEFLYPTREAAVGK